MQSLPRASTATRLPAEIILEKIYPQSSNLEAVIERLVPSCDLFNDTDPAAYIKLCSSALVAFEKDYDVLSPDLTSSQALSAISSLPGARSLGWNDQVPVKSVLNAVPVDVSSCCSALRITFTSLFSSRETPSILFLISQ